MDYNKILNKIVNGLRSEDKMAEYMNFYVQNDENFMTMNMFMEKIANKVMNNFYTYKFDENIKLMNHLKEIYEQGNFLPDDVWVEDLGNGDFISYDKDYQYNLMTTLIENKIMPAYELAVSYNLSNLNDFLDAIINSIECDNVLKEFLRKQFITLFR